MSGVFTAGRSGVLIDVRTVGRSSSVRDEYGGFRIDSSVINFYEFLRALENAAPFDPARARQFEAALADLQQFVAQIP